MSLLAEDLTPEERAVLAAQTPRYSKHELAQIAARRAAQEFIEATPSFNPSEANLTVIVELMIKHGMEPLVANFTLAHNALAQAGLIEEADPDAPQPSPEPTLADIDRMPSDEYRKRLNDPAFVDLVNRLEAAKPKIVWRGRVRT
jgi:hypothetical protein